MRARNIWMAGLLALGLYGGMTAVAAQAQGEKAKPSEKKSAAQAGQKLGEAEELSGTIAAVDATAATVTIRANGTPYVFRVTKKTKITIHGSKGDLEGLAKQVSQNITVKFVPRSNGNFAEHVEVKS